MDTSKLKRFAPKCRAQLIEQVGVKRQGEGRPARTSCFSLASGRTKRRQMSLTR